MNVFEVGEKVHIVERRLFSDDVRRHFIGEIISFSEAAIRTKGFTWVYNENEAKYSRRKGKRERVFILGDRIIINILPKELEPEHLIYASDDAKKQWITDGKDFTMDFTEFSNG